MKKGEETTHRRTIFNPNSGNRRLRNRTFFEFVGIFVILCILLFLLIKNKNRGNLPEGVTYLDESDDIMYKLDPKNIRIDKETEIEYVDNIVIVFFDAGYSEENIKEVEELIAGKEVGHISLINQHQFKVKSRDYNSLLSLCEQIKVLPHVDDALPDLALQLIEDAIPNDPWGNELGANWDVDYPAGNEWWAEAINMPEAWEYHDCYETIIIGIYDSGVDVEHEDLAGVVTKVSKNNTAGNHGTHVAGIIGAKSNNEIGICGIVWDCELLTYKIDNPNLWQQANPFYSTITHFMKQIKSLVVNGAKIINVSQGRAKPIDNKKKLFSEGCGFSKYMCKLLEQGYDFVIVQAAGNNGDLYAENNGLFCAINKENCASSERIKREDVLDRVIVVGSAGMNGYDRSYCMSDFSSFGDAVDICAPGENVFSTVNQGEKRAEGKKYDYKSGTSMATPMVTGVAALVWAANSELTGAEVKEIVCGNTKYIVERDGDPIVYRLVNAEMAVKASLERKKTFIISKEITDDEGLTALSEINKGDEKEYWLLQSEINTAHFDKTQFPYYSDESSYMNIKYDYSQNLMTVAVTSDFDIRRGAEAEEIRVWYKDGHIEKIVEDNTDTISFEYDNRGFLLYKDYYYPEASFEENKYKRYEYKYDDKGRIVARGEDLYEYDYNEGGKLIKETIHSGSDCIVVEYNEKGDVIKTWDHFECDVAVEDSYDIYTYEYDENGRVIKRSNYWSYYPNSELYLGGWYEYEYNSEGMVSFRYLYDSEGLLKETTMYTYTLSNYDDGTFGIMSYENVVKKIISGDSIFTN